jgi:hypothetical protein
MRSKILLMIITFCLTLAISACKEQPDPREMQQRMRQNPNPAPQQQEPVQQSKDEGLDTMGGAIQDQPGVSDSAESEEPEEETEESPSDDESSGEEDSTAEEEPSPFGGMGNVEQGSADEGPDMVEKVRTYNIFMEQFTSGFKNEDLMVKLSTDFRSNKDYQIFGAVDGIKFFPYRLLNSREDYCLVLRYENMEDMETAFTRTIPQFFEDSEREFNKKDFILMGNYVLYLNGDFEEFRRKRLRNVFREIIQTNKDN